MTFKPLLRYCLQQVAISGPLNYITLIFETRAHVCVYRTIYEVVRLMKFNISLLLKRIHVNVYTHSENVCN